jgi:hypothetical protein
MLTRLQGEAPLLFPGFAHFKVVTARKYKNCDAAPAGFCDSAVHTAILIAGSESEWRVLETSEERECLVDAVEELWENVLDKAGELCGECPDCAEN